MKQPQQHEFTVGYLFCGAGVGAFGADRAEVEVDGHVARVRNVGGIDFEQERCDTFTKLTGARSLCADIGRMRPRELRAFFGEEAPYFMKWSPPCKGASRLISRARAATKKYQDMNRLAVLAARKVLAAYPRKRLVNGNVVRGCAVVVIENVPAYKHRCPENLAEVVRLGRRAGYEVSVVEHNLGEEAGLAQNRQRLTICFRDPEQCPVPVAMPTKKRLRGVGEVLGPLPFPDDPRAGKHHRLPRIEWLNVVRLALVPPGGDWRDLPPRGGVVEWLEARGWWPPGVDTGPFRAMVEEQLGTPLQPGQERREVHRRHPVQGWESPAPTVSGPGGAGLSAVQDPRLEGVGLGHAPRRGAEGVAAWNAPAPTVRGVARHDNGGAAVSDSRVLDALPLIADGRKGTCGVIPWDGTAGTVIGMPYVSGGSTPVSVADPRALDGLAMSTDNDGRHTTKYAVGDWTKPARTVTGSVQPGSGGQATSDQRILELVGLGQTANAAASYKGRPGLFGVLREDMPAATVSGNAQVSGSNTPAALADSRPGAVLESLGVGVNCRNGFYGVLEWEATARTITGSMQLDNGTAVVADPRMPSPRLIIDIRLALALLAEGWEVPKGALAPAVISPLSGCWHRPLTTLELAVLQGLPPIIDGAPLEFVSNSDDRVRSMVGDGIPAGGALVWMEEQLRAALKSKLGHGWSLLPDFWFRPGTEALAS